MSSVKIDERAILDAAAEEFAEKGFSGARVDKIAKIAGNAKTLPEEGMQGIKGFMDTIRSMVTIGVEEGTFRNIDPVALQFLVMGAVFTLSLTAQMRQELNPGNPGPITAEQISGALGDIISRGILK